MQEKQTIESKNLRKHEIRQRVCPKSTHKFISDEMVTKNPERTFLYMSQSCESKFYFPMNFLS